MREVKFRAWNKETNKMCDAESLQEMLHTERNNGIAEGSLRIEQSPIDKANEEYDHLIFLQYTGLRDKNGVEIHEGDILEDTFERDEEDEKRYLIMEWNSQWGGFVLVEEDEELDIMEYFCQEDFEIIGNIYENPELLSNAVDSGKE